MPGALKYRNFRLFFFGQTVSLIGTWMQLVAMSWLVYEMTGSAFWLGMVGFCGQLPSFFLAPLAGVYADRWNRHRTIVFMQTLAMVQAFILAALVLCRVVEVWHIVLLSVFLGVVTAFEVPTRQSFFIQMVEGREALTSAIGLNSSMFNAARIIGPAIAGFTIARTGEGICFLLNGLSYIAVIAALLAMRLPPREPAPPRRHVLVELAEGLRYVAGFPPIREILLLLVFVNLVSIPLSNVLLPVFAKNVLAGDARTLGMLSSAMGVGALFGVLRLAFRKSVLGLGRQIAWSAALFGLGLIAFSFSPVLWLSMGMLAASGYCLMLGTASGNTIVQTIVDDSMRGRVMSFYVMAFFGVAPLGSLLAGSLIGRLGAPRVAQLGGAMCMVTAIAFAFRLPVIREHIRPIYRRIGILPERLVGDTDGGRLCGGRRIVGRNKRCAVPAMGLFEEASAGTALRLFRPTSTAVRDNFDWRNLRGLGKMLRSMFSVPESRARSAL